MTRKIPYLFLLLVLSWGATLHAQQRFPQPEFGSGYKYPEYSAANPSSPLWEYVDVGILVVLLAVTTRLTLKTRSRRSILLMSLFSLCYFGFFRKGCICSIGAIQNVALVLFNDGYALPLSALLFFLIPILFTIAFGRQFCAGVCPFGAIQELTGIYPLKTPRSMEVILSMVPYIYLAFAVLFAATDTHFIICKYDPYVGIFRLNGPATIIVFGILLLISGIFINRPYCRYLCPYGVILNWVSRFAGRHLSITPDICTNCRLCEDACPYEGIEPATLSRVEDNREKARKRFAGALLFLPIITLGGAIFVQAFSENLATVHSSVRLAREIRLEKTRGIDAVSIEAAVFKESGKTIDQLFQEERQILGRFRKSTLWVGGFLGLSFALALLLTTISRRREEYKPHQGKCYSCGRCFEYCPVHIEKLHSK